LAHFYSAIDTSLEKTSSLVEQSVNRLEEYRAALITAAVTGKLRELQ
jgi:hypothetical protein